VFEVYPEITIADVSRAGLKSRCSVTDAEVDKTLEVLRKQRTTYVPDRAQSQDGDRVW
jgi:trigger factor